ncbi:Alpha/beta hydrolase domain-containing protein [Sphingopyxis sp. LC81]|uniref:alpha/beta hydrolase n=1 Tax=Sphingopyxis sp. LC81 TaxID=1502850 RepID=UPI00050F035A|nr:alpha/beta hydrolase [Sphingopyxis sp. LC81]KGB56753.1 Alpha/beta hydrolase domain-containing protein [Sphingopyxis sp. LC81]
MPIDPALAPLLDMMNALPHLNAPFDPAALRLADEQPMPVPKAGVAEVRDVTLDTSAGAVNARLYHPMPGTTLPLLVFIHGGGWVFGTLDTHDPLCRALAAAAEIAVLSLEYPRAPEHRFPTALDTVRAAVVTAVEQADALSIDAGRIAVGGDSAGGNLSAALCLATRDEGGPAIAHQLLLYPVVDNDFTRTSHIENATGYMLSSEMMQWFWAQYLGDAGRAAGPLATPIRADSLAGLPSATIVTAEFDPLRDEGIAYAERLKAAGVAVTHDHFPGVIHGFASMLGMLPQADVAVGTAARGLRAAFAMEAVA